MNENNNKRWGRRATSVVAWITLLTVAYYICMFKGMDLTWFSEYAKWGTFGLGFLVGGLTITDSILTKGIKK